MVDGPTKDRQPSAPVQGEPAAVLELMLLAATLLFVNGQTTERTIETTVRLAGALGFRGDLLPRWGELTATIDDGSGSRAATVAANPVGVDMGKVAAATGVIDQLCDGSIDTDDGARRRWRRSGAGRRSRSCASRRWPRPVPLRSA